MGAPSKTQTVTTQELAPEQQQLLDLVIPVAKQFVQNPPRLPQESTIAPVDPLQQQAHQAVLGRVGDLTGASDALLRNNVKLAQGGATIGLQGLGSLLKGAAPASSAQNFLLSGAASDPTKNPALLQELNTVRQRLTENLTQNVLPTIRSGAVQAGQLGGTRQGIAEGLATKGTQQAVGDASARILNNAFNAGLQAQLGALGQTLGTIAQASDAGLSNASRALFAAPQTLQASVFPQQLVENIGQFRRNEQQAALDEATTRFFAEQLLPFQAAQEVAALAFGIPAGSVTSTAGQLKASGLSRGIGGALGGAGLGSVFGIPGTIIGALLGGLGGLFG